MISSVPQRAEYPTVTWRLLFDLHPRPGALNMAIDEAVARAVAARTAPPTLRLYAWSPPTLTLGRGQPYADADVEALRRAGVQLVRRMTGGTAVLNRDELSYTVAVTDREPRLAGRSIAESYRGVSSALLHALARLGLESAEANTFVEGESRPRREARSPVCFELPSDYEITVEGRKLFGSSQMRIRGGTLQHGSLPLGGDIADISRFLVARPDPARIRSLALTLYDALGRWVTWEEAAEAVRDGFREMLNLDLVTGPLTAEERGEVERLVVEKYGSAAWTARV
jgi:lipoyl(octanoyl) transferase